jgi:cysteine desulfurase
MKLPIDVNSFGADLITASAHKIGGPKGAGFLYVRSGVNMAPVYYGGGQERNIFSGTENAAAIAGLAKAAEEYDNAPVRGLRGIFVSGLKEGAKINAGAAQIPNIINISIDGTRSEIALHILESKGIYVSSGSACSQKKGDRNRVLKNFGLSAREQDSALRISISPYNTADEVEAAAMAVNELARAAKDGGPMHG